MSYTINKSDDTILTTVEDGTLNTATSLRLIGKNYTNFGEVFNENLVHLLENFSNASAPVNALEGQLWYDRSEEKIKVFDGSVFKGLSIIRLGSTAPTSNLSAGDFWYDTTNAQLYLSNGTLHKLVGPMYTDSQGESGCLVESILDTGGTTRVVLKFVQAGNTVAYVSPVTFTPSVAKTGFATIKAGLTFSTVYSDMKFQGTSTNADNVDSIDSTQFMRLDLANTAAGKLTLANDAGLELGSNNFVKVNVSNDDLYVKNEATNKDIIFQVTDNSTTSTQLTIDGSQSRVVVANNLTAGTITTSGDVTVSGGDVTADNFVGTITTASQPNITTIGTLSNLNVTGGITSGSTVTATNLQGTLTTAAQTNITSVGTLGSLAVTGTATANTFSATTLTGTLSTPAQTNINQVGTLSGLQVSGSATFNNGINVASGVISGTLGTGNQTAITSVGTLTGLTVSGTASIGTLSLTNELAITEGGTGATTAAGARSNLGVVSKSGDTMTGLLTLSGVPTATNHAATKGYVDAVVAGDVTGFATESYANNTAKWQGANKHVSTSTPTASDGVDGDIWFVREA